MMPQKFQNKTNGVTPRRWLAWCNPALAALITKALGDDAWINDTTRLAGLRKFADDKGFQAKWRAIKLANKERLAAKIKVCSFCPWSLNLIPSVHRVPGGPSFGPGGCYLFLEYPIPQVHHVPGGCSVGP